MSGRLKPQDKKLLEAVRKNDSKQLKVALSSGANVNASEADLEQPLHIAVENGFSTLVTILVAQRNIHLDDKTLFESTPLGTATTYQDIKILKILLKAGANPNCTQLFLQTPLHTAVMHGNFECARVLIKYGANVNIPDCFDQTPLYLSLISNPHHKITKLLLYAGADPNYKYNRKIPILSMAVMHARTVSDIKSIASLIKQGANINEGDMVMNETPLHKAAFTGFVPIIRFLVQNGADLNSKNVFNAVPFDTAKHYYNYAAAYELRKLAEIKEQEEITKLFHKSSRSKKTQFSKKK